VYNDVNGNQLLDAGDTPQADVLVTLTGKSASGLVVNVQTFTDAAGFYAFDGLAAGTYTLTETPPSGTTNDAAFVGSQNSGTVGAADIFNIVLKANTNGINNNFLNTLAAS